MATATHDVSRPDDAPGSAIPAYDEGRAVFARMFTRWMDGNGWSHPVMTKLARGCMGGEQGWLHSSQIASLRAGDSRNPGPRTFVAIERLNYYLYRYVTDRELLPLSTSSNDYREAAPILEADKPPGLGWFVEVFAGYRTPRDFDLALVKIPPDQGERCARQLGRLLRRLFTENGHDVVEDVSSVLYAHYPTKERANLDLVRHLIQGFTTVDTTQLEAEMANLAALVTALRREPTTEDDLLRQIRR
jgi:hypothetical protein